MNFAQSQNLRSEPYRNFWPDFSPFLLNYRVFFFLRNFRKNGKMGGGYGPVPSAPVWLKVRGMALCTRSESDPKIPKMAYPSVPQPHISGPTALPQRRPYAPCNRHCISARYVVYNGRGHESHQRTVTVPPLVVSFRERSCNRHKEDADDGTLIRGGQLSPLAGRPSETSPLVSLGGPESPIYQFVT